MTCSGVATAAVRSGAAVRWRERSAKSTGCAAGFTGCDLVLLIAALGVCWRASTGAVSASSRIPTITDGEHMVQSTAAHGCGECCARASVCRATPRRVQGSAPF
eukprot:6195792-Pleurochrysis_carterae.AAC.5